MGRSRPTTRILDGITAEAVTDIPCDMYVDVVRNPAWSSLVMKRVAAKAMPLMSKNERDWTRATTDRDTLQVLLLRETLGADHAFLYQKRTEGVVVTP